MLGSHLVFCAYGLWLPNDPRGSWSKNVRAHHLYEIGGEATTVHVRRSIASQAHDKANRLAAKQSLARPAVALSGIQARAAARGIREMLPKLRLTIHALAILPDHVHIVAAAHVLDADQLIAALKRAATRGMNAETVHPLKERPRSNGRLPSPWAEGGWKTFLHTPQDMHRAIQYVENNPVRAGLKPQRWSCVTPYAP